MTHKEMALGPENLQEAYDIIAAATALGVELPAPQGTLVYEANARTKGLDATADIVFDQHLGLYSSLVSAMLALAGFALEGLEKSSYKPWLPNAVPGVLYNIPGVLEADEKKLKSEWVQSQTLHSIILSYYADYAVAKRKVDSEPYDKMSVLHNAELGI
jgi:hypothetical protein